MDLRTIAWLSAVAAALSWLTFLAVHDRNTVRDRPYLTLWGSGLLAQALAWCLMAQRGAWPDVLTVLTNNLVLLTALLAYLRGLRAFYGERVARPHDLWVLGAGVVTNLPFVVWPESSPTLRVLLASMPFLVVFAELVMTLWRGSPRPWPRAAVVMAILFGTTFVILAARAGAHAGILIGWLSPELIVGSQIVVMMITALLPLLATLCFVLMDNDRLADALRHEADHDPLTGLPNRRFLEQRGKAQLREARGVPVSVLLVDVDRFKAINDRHGHAVGDIVLRRLAERMVGNTRPGDLVGRIGGEEFLWLLPGTTLKEAEQVAARLCVAVHEDTIDVPDAALHLSISVGVAEGIGGVPDADLWELVRRADAAMYRAKAAGGNRVETAS